MTGREIAVALAVAVGSALGVADAAEGALIDLNRGNFSQGPGSPGQQGATTDCGPGSPYKAIGAGGEISGGSGEVWLKDLRPNAGLSAWTAQGWEDADGFDGQWSVTTYAICARPPPGLHRLVATSPSSSQNKSVTAACPPGEQLVGAGGAILGGGGGALLNDVKPASGGVTVQGVEAQGGVAAAWRATAAAVCAPRVAGLERIVATSATNSTDKTVSASCSPGRRVIAAGGELGGGGGQIGLEALRPTPSLESVSATASEDEDGTAANWFVRAYAICADVTERVQASAAASSVDKSVSAACDPGMQATGGGGDVTAGGGQVALEDLVPLSSGLFAEAREDGDGTFANWSLRAYAICASPLPGIERVSASGVVDSDDSKGVTATCPTGKRVVGAGAAIANGSGEVNLQTIAPNADLTAVVGGAVEDDTTYAGQWSITAHAVCARRPPGLELVTATVGPDSDPASVTASCPAGKYLLGDGGQIISGHGQVVFDDFRPDSGLSNVMVTGLEDQTGFGSEWFLRAHAICASY